MLEFLLYFRIGLMTIDLLLLALRTYLEIEVELFNKLELNKDLKAIMNDALETSVVLLLLLFLDPPM